jgi:hypothetical protein
MGSWDYKAVGAANMQREKYFTMKLQMRFLVIVAALLAVCALPAVADPVPVDTLTMLAADSTTPPPIVDPTYWLGESMEFKVMFGFVPAGKARLAVLDTTLMGGQTVVRAVSSARSARAYDLIFKVRDSIETWFDADSVYSHQFRKQLHEGGYHDEKLVKFDLENWKVHWWDDGLEKPVLYVSPRVHDVLCAGFKARMIPLIVGDTTVIATQDVNKSYQMLVITHARETIKTIFGEVECLKVEPVFSSGGIFKKERGARLFVWVTADQYRIPVKVQSRVSFGSFVAELDKYERPYWRR